MKQTIVSGLGIFLCLPVFAGARLPTVNIAAGSVSARAQYGLPTSNVNTNKNIAKVSKKAERRNVVARSTRRATTAAANVSVDTGAKIAANTEYLVPNRPSSNLWAKNETPLRMPHANEFSVITSDAMLPEESIEPHSQTIAMDSQIEKLMEMQRKADASVNNQAAQRNMPSVETIITPADLVAVNVPEKSMPIRKDIATTKSTTTADGVKLSRLVVPRDDKVVADVTTPNPRKNVATKIKETREDMTKMSPSELRRAFRKTFLSENKHLSTYSIDDGFDVASDLGDSFEGFTSARDLSEDVDKIRPLEIKIRFRNSDSALSRDNYNLLSEYAGVVVANPKRAIQIAIPVAATETSNARKLAARRLTIIEQVLRDTGISEQRIIPVLSQRDDEGFVLRIISNEQYETLTRQKRNMFGDTVDSKTYRSMSW